MKHDQESRKNQYKGINMQMAPPVALGVTVQKVAKKGKKGKGQFNAAQYEEKKMTNYDLLKRLGFDESLIGENKKLGLKEKTNQSL